MHSTDNLNDGYIGSGKKLWYSVKKYGKENFKLEILEMLPNRRSLKEREKELVNEDILKDPMCLNLKIGGEGGFVNDEHKKNFLNRAITMFIVNKDKIKKRKKELFLNNEIWAKEYSKNMSKNSKGNKSWTGKKHKEETKQKIGLKNSIKQKGENNSQYGTMWITNGIENKKIKKETEIPQGWYKGRK